MSRPESRVRSRTDLVVGGLFLVLGVYLTVSAAALPSDSGGLPGAGFFPRIIGVVTVLLSSALLLKAL